MTPRTTRVKQIKMDSLSYSSLFQIGDANEIEPNADVLAVQKEGGISSDKGFELNQYPIFNRTIQTIPDTEVVVGEHCHHEKNISVSTIDIMAVSTSSVVQLGCNKKIDSLARQKHIRILKDEEEDNR
ncbi:spore germination protein PE [Gracilibacillus orientalis]|uniref:Spore germination protein PE n=1 Tax=Gracilibacillus orientalis TaxID=334253 RepID=A0A1I4H8U2_9BACI|nr:spore germination protein GerPE [Gracilibacillus orientalis]SFL38037.1 spore germination protein PE [Gracilibacillus orientalis]